MHSNGKKDLPSYRDIVRARQKNRHFLRNSVVMVALGLFGAAAALDVVKPSEAPEIQYTQKRLALPSPLPAPLGQAESTDGAAAQPYLSETRIRPGDTLAALLQRLQVSEEGLQAFLVQEKAARAIYKLYPGRSVQAALDGEGHLVWLRYNHTPSATENGQAVAKWLEVRPDAQAPQGFTATELSAAADTQIRIAEGTIESSLFGATDKAGIPDAVTLQMADILSSKIDFMKDLRSGDRFQVIYETLSHEGRDSGAGRILALEFINKGQSYQAVWFQPEGGTGAYYDFDGKGLKGAFLRTALKFTRISSTFGMRKHPIHGRWIGHKGVDYAAPAGTPIHATANGVVEFVGVQRGYGNVVIISHAGKHSTLYAHQSRFAKGLRKGQKVSQGQLIGYVGSTGWATGPHLHYEFRVAGKPVNPLSVKLPVATALEASQRQAFDGIMAQYRDQFSLLIARHDTDAKADAEG